MSREKNRQYYQKFASDFEKIPFNPLIQDLVDKYAKTPASILDVGSGPGALAKELQAAGFEVTCLDPVREMIDRCQEKGLKTILGTIESVELQYHMVLAISSLIHVPESEFLANLKLIREKLLPEGKLIISMLIGEGEHYEDPLKKGSERYFRYYSQDVLRSHFLLNGFRIVEEYERESGRMQKHFAVYVLESFQS